MSSTKVAHRVGVQASDLAYVAVFAALLAALSLAPAIPMGPIGVPITLQTLGVALCGLCLGPWRGSAAVLLYTLVGLAGLPVFAQGRAGIGVLATPTAGYLIAFPIATLIVGFAARYLVRRGLTRWTPLWFVLVLVVVRILVICPIGVMGLMRALGISAGEAFMVDLPFWIGDLIKSVIAAFLAYGVHRAFPRLLGR